MRLWVLARELDQGVGGVARELDERVGGVAEEKGWWTGRGREVKGVAGRARGQGERRPGQGTLRVVEAGPARCSRG